MWQHSRLGDPLYTNLNARLALWESNQPGHYLHKSVLIQDTASGVLARQYIIRDQEVEHVKSRPAPGFICRAAAFPFKTSFLYMETSFYKALLVRFLSSDVGQRWTTHIATIKGKGISLQAWRSPQGFPEFEAPRLQDSQYLQVVRLSALRTGRLYPPRKYSW